jgi:phage shock protein PspC (stress-responsive transcriptional regulator)
MGEKFPREKGRKSPAAPQLKIHRLLTLFQGRTQLVWRCLTFRLLLSILSPETKNRMTRSATDKWLGGVLAGIARALGTSSGLIRGLFLVFFFGVGGLTFGISSGATVVIYLIFWMTLSKS